MNRAFRANGSGWAREMAVVAICLMPIMTIVLPVFRMSLGSDQEAGAISPR